MSDLKEDTYALFGWFRDIAHTIVSFLFYIVFGAACLTLGAYNSTHVIGFINKAVPIVEEYIEERVDPPTSLKGMGADKLNTERSSPQLM